MWRVTCSSIKSLVNFGGGMAKVYIIRLTAGKSLRINACSSAEGRQVININMYFNKIFILI